MTTTLKPNPTQILGAAIVGLLDGKLTDETINAVDTINRADVPEVVGDVVGFMHGMTMQPALRESCIASLIGEIGWAADEALHKIRGEAQPVDDWALMNSLFFDIFENEHVEDMIEEEITILQDLEPIQKWFVPLIDHLKSSKARHKELMLELLDLFEEIIKKRRAELSQ